MALTQDQRQFIVTTPLEKDVLLFYTMHGSEELGRLFKYELDLLSTDANINLDDVLGKQITVELALANDKKRHFNGYVSSFRYMGMQEDYHLYKATLRPWLWFLTRSADCRIFQNKTVPDIIKEVFRDFGYSEFEDQLSETYNQWEYCVQYRETAFNFISRLMEQEGIYYYFKHEQDVHTLVLADSIAAHSRIADYENIPYYPPQQREHREGEYVDDWYTSKGIEPQRYTLSDFDFTKPKSSLEVRETIEDGYSDFEVFDYPGEYTQLEAGQAAARTRAEQYETNYERVNAKGNLRALTVGGLFELTNYPRDDQNKEYLLLSACYYLRSDLYRSKKEAPSVPDYRIVFTAMDSIHPFRSAPTTPQPKVQGPQTAIVVGPEGEQIWTDEYGRVKVQFHWDRYGKKDQDSSCWIRVSHTWAGKVWGGMHIPHVGQEVIVEFLEGDPDRPIITGRVYNADNMPPIDLPKNKTKSIFRDDYGNELIFDATPGDEHIRLYSPHNNSGMEIGRSIKQWQGGGEGQEWITTSAGNAMEFFAGTKSEFLAGGTMEFKLGLFHEVALGLTSAFSLGGNLGFNIGYDVSGQLGPKREWSKADVNSLSDKDNIISANNVLCLIGGAGKVAAPPPTDNTSILRAEEEGITLTVGEKQGDFSPEFNEIAKVAMFATVTNSVLAFLSQLAVEEVAVNVTPWALFAEVIPAYFAGGSVASSIAMSAALMDPSIKPKVVKHANPKAKVNLHRDGNITINSTEKQVEISVGKSGQEKTKITIDNQGNINIKGENVTFDGGGTIDMTKHVVKTSNGKLMIDDSKILVKQNFFKHKYLSVG